MIAEPTTPIEIFICYAREDEEYREGLEKQLRILKRQGFITIWHDREIIPGTEWQSEIDRHLKSAQIILLLVSPDFMDSDYCYSIEMQNAMLRHQRGEAHVIPIIVHHVYWQEAPFGKLQVLPTDARPITDHSWHNLNEAFYNVAVGIREVINKVREEQQRLAEEDRQRKLREEQQRLAEEDRQRKLREEQQRLAEEDRQRKLREEQQRKLREEQLRQAEEERQRRTEEERRQSQYQQGQPYIQQYGQVGYQQQPMVLRCPVCMAMLPVGTANCSECRTNLAGVVPTPATMPMQGQQGGRLGGMFQGGNMALDALGGAAAVSSQSPISDEQPNVTPYFPNNQTIHHNPISTETDSHVLDLKSKERIANRFATAGCLGTMIGIAILIISVVAGWGWMYYIIMSLVTLAAIVWFFYFVGKWSDYDQQLKSLSKTSKNP